MPRNLPSDFKIALAQPTVELFYAVKLFITENSPDCLWTGYGDKTINGDIYVGTGKLMKFGDVKEHSNLTANGMSIALGLDSSIMSKALSMHTQYKKAQVFQGVVGCASVISIYSGLIDTFDIISEAERTTLILKLENKKRLLKRANVRRLNDANHKVRFPNDNFFAALNSTVDKEIRWGKS